MSLYLCTKFTDFGQLKQCICMPEGCKLPCLSSLFNYPVHSYLYIAIPLEYSKEEPYNALYTSILLYKHNSIYKHSVDRADTQCSLC